MVPLVNQAGMAMMVNQVLLEILEKKVQLERLDLLVFLVFVDFVELRVIWVHKGREGRKETKERRVPLGPLVYQEGMALMALRETKVHVEDRDKVVIPAQMEPQVPKDLLDLKDLLEHQEQVVSQALLVQ